MRRGVQASPKARMAKDGLQERRGRTLAICPGNVRRRISAVGPHQALGQHRNILEIKLRRGGLRRRSEFSAERKQIANSSVVVHVSSIACQRNSMSAQ